MDVGPDVDLIWREENVSMVGPLALHAMTCRLGDPAWSFLWVSCLLAICCMPCNEGAHPSCACRKSGGLSCQSMHPESW